MGFINQLITGGHHPVRILAFTGTRFHFGNAGELKAKNTCLQTEHSIVGLALQASGEKYCIALSSRKAAIHEPFLFKKIVALSHYMFHVWIACCIGMTERQHI